MKKFNLTSLSVLLSVILVGCGSSSDLNDNSGTEENQFKSDEKIEDKIDIDILIKEDEEYKESTNYQIVSISNADRDRFLSEINSARASSQNCGSEGSFSSAPSLKWSTELYNASYEHNYDMLHSQTFSHDGSATQYDITGILIEQASTPYTRIVQTGYFKDAFYYGIEENIAEGQQNITEVIEQWLSDDLHCANIMREEFMEVGISKIKSSYGYYWTSILGYR